VRHGGKVAVAVAVSGVTAAAGYAVLGPLSPDEPPPVTAEDDSVSIYPGESEHLRPLENDSAPGDERLRVCSDFTGSTAALHYEYFESQDFFHVEARPKAVPGTHSFTYTVCAGGEWATARVDVTVLAAPGVTVTKMPRRPGRLRVSNPGDVPVRFSFGSTTRSAGQDGDFRLGPHETRVFSVRRHDIGWRAGGGEALDAPTFIVDGEVHDIVLPAGVESLPDRRGG